VKFIPPLYSQLRRRGQTESELDVGNNYS
jgi:hypothetical protein